LAKRLNSGGGERVLGDKKDNKIYFLAFENMKKNGLLTFKNLAEVCEGNTSESIYNDDLMMIFAGCST
jgi:hypothetical protein